MIDNKKIDEAARYYCNNRYSASPDAPFIAEGFRQGAKWAVNEFLKDLWHPNTEEPDKSDIIPLVSITMLTYSLRNPFFGLRNLGDIRLADVKSPSGLIFPIYYQRKEVRNEQKKADRINQKLVEIL